MLLYVGYLARFCFLMRQPIKCHKILTVYAGRIVETSGVKHR